MNLIRLTYSHYRNLFQRKEGNVVYKNYIKNNFTDIKFEGFEYGYYYPSILVKLDEYNKCNFKKYQQPFKTEQIFL